MRISELVPILAREYFRATRQYPNKTKLIKLVYLAEVYFKRYTNQRLTEQKWVFWKYGPFFSEFENLVENQSIFEKPDRADDFYPIIVRLDYDQRELSIEEHAAVMRAMDHAHTELNELLDYVYFETEPMVKAEERGEVLDFDAIYPPEHYVVREYKISPRQGAEIVKKVREWKARLQNA